MQFLFFILRYFLPFYHLTAKKMIISKQWKKTLGYIIILHNCTKNHDHILYCSWDMACDNYNSHFLFWAIFCLPLPLTAPKMTISKHMKKAPGDIIILHKCTKNHDHDHTISCSWDMACDECNYFSFWAIFCPFTTLTAQKIEISEKWKKCLDIIILHMCTKNYAS